MYGCLPHLSSVCTANCLLDREYECCFGNQSLHCVLGRVSSFLCGFYSPVKEQSLSLVFGVVDSRSDCKLWCDVSETVVLSL